MAKKKNRRKNHKKTQKINQKRNTIKKANSEKFKSVALQLIVPFCITSFVSACLLFMVQPMVAKMLLPFLGGAPAVWTTCMVFFQTLLLGGYLYAHLIGQKYSLSKQTKIHAALLLASAFCVPFGISSYWGIFEGLHPVFSVLALLTITVGLPFFTLSASAPLLQNWFAQSGHPSAQNPYFLYVGSNIGSLLVLVSYPTILEPTMGLTQQSTVWASGFALMAIIVGACTYMLRKSREFFEVQQAEMDIVGNTDVQHVQAEKNSKPPSFGERARWIGLAFIPSSLMLGLTTYFTTDIATIPLFWTMPLAIYLLSFIIVFAEWPDNMFRLVRFITPLAIILLLYVIISRSYLPVLVNFFLHLVVLFLVALNCHGMLARTKPKVEYLTHFYLWMSFGGMLGGIFNGIIAPLIFNSAIEYKLVLVLPCLLLNLKWAVRLIQHKGTDRVLDFTLPLIAGGIVYWLIKVWPENPIGLDWINQFFGAKGYRLLYDVSYIGSTLVCGGLIIFGRPARLALGLAALVFVTIYWEPSANHVVFRDRSFFGILKVSEDYYGHFRSLTNGTTLHGQQALNPAFSREPLTYYHRTGPVGSIFREFGGAKAKSLAFVGLGTGTLSTYGQPGQTMDIYEIDDHVVHIAENYFTYLKQAEAKYNIILGDARLRMKEAEDHSYDILLVDAFSSDAIPVHMLTREAIQLYFQKVKKNGVVGIHTSNRYLQLEPILGKLAKEEGLVARVNHDMSDNQVGKSASSWVILTRKEVHLRSLASSNAWKPIRTAPWIPLWTDNFTSVFSVLR